MDKFLTPEAMLTPGAAGGVVMLVATALANNFGLSPLSMSYLGLGLSFTFGLLILSSARIWWTRLVYYFLNSLIIFCVAFGSGNLIAAQPPQQAVHAAALFFSSAYAADTATTELAGLKAEYTRLSARYDAGLAKLADLQQAGAAQTRIDRQVSVLQHIQNLKNANLRKQLTLVRKGAVLGGSNRSDAAKDTHAEEKQQIFRPWVSPFKR